MHMQRRGCLQFFDLVDMPVIVHRQVRSLYGDVVATPVVAQWRFLWSVPVFLLLQYIDEVVVVFCTGSSVGDSRAPTVAALTRSLTCPLCSTTARGSTCRKLHWSRSCCAFFLWPMSLLCKSCWCRFLRLWTACDHAATSSFSSTVEVPQIQLSPVTVDIPVVQQRRPRLPTELVMTAMKGFLMHFVSFFALLRVVPELSASFSSFRVLTPVSARGLQGCRSRQEFYPQ